MMDKGGIGMRQGSEDFDEYEVAELLLADSSRSSVRTAICVLFTVGGPLIALIPMYFADRWDTVLYCSIGGPITGLCGSILWLFWPWIRSDMQRNAFVVFRSHRRDEPDEGQRDDNFRRVVGRALDQAEKRSYWFVGATLALSWLLSTVAVLAPIFASSPAAIDISAIEQQMIGLSKVVKDHTRHLEDLERMSKVR